MDRPASLGLFGGTFDPPHVGHLILAGEACAQLGLDRLLWVLTPDPPHKQGRRISPLPHRLAMVELALAGNPDFVLSRVDIDRPPPHYAVDTVRLLQAQHPGAGIIYLMGGDSLSDLPDWHTPHEFVEAVGAIGVMRRPGESTDLTSLEQQLPGISRKVGWINAPLLEISSTEIRQNVAAGRHFRYYLPEAVYRYIQEHGLYRENS